ncbi:antitoxin VapB family protein [Planctomycetota bacterium]
MAVKTITIDMEAYSLLAADKREGESFSKVIKRRLRPLCTAAALLAKLDQLRLSEDTLDRLDHLVEARRDSVAESPIIDLAG